MTPWKITCVVCGHFFVHSHFDPRWLDHNTFCGNCGSENEQNFEPIVELEGIDD